VSCVSIKGKLIEQDSSCIPVKYDFLLSGNNEVVHWANKHNIKAINVPRPKGIGFSGTELRSLVDNR